MTLDNGASYYLALLTVQITVLTLIAAGVIALYQIHDKQSPKRDFKAVISRRYIVAYFTLAVVLIVVTSLLALTISFPHNIFSAHDYNSIQTASNVFIGLAITLLTLVMCGSFFYLLWRSRSLLDTKKYLEITGSKLDQQKLSDYLFHAYSTKPMPYIEFMFSSAKKKPSATKKREEKKQAKDRMTEWEVRYAKTLNTVNPLAAFVDYCRNNANSSGGDVEKVGLPMLRNILIKYIDSDHEDSQFVPTYLHDVTSDLKEAFAGSSLAVRKTYIDLLADLALHYCNEKRYSSMVNLAGQIHQFTRGVDNEEIKLHAVVRIREISKQYCELEKNQKDWRKFDENLQELALVVARISEDYYHNLTDLSPISIIENNRTELNDFGSEMANYFADYDDLHEKYPDIIPVIYFDAVDVSAEALINAINRSEVIKHGIGLSSNRYEQIVGTLYWPFYSYAKAGIESGNADLVKLCVYRMCRGLKFMKDKNVDDCALDLADSMVSIGIRLACNEKLKDLTTYGGKPMLDEIAVTINQFADTEKLAARKSSIEHTLFEFVYKPEATAFERLLVGW